MIAAVSLELLARLVLWLLAAYHLVLGAAALLAPPLAVRLVRSLYGAAVPEGGAFRYMTSMIGALALAVGWLAAVAARAPAEHRAVVGALVLLQLCRIFCRLRDRRLLARSLGVSARSNGAAVVVLGAECAVLGLWLR